jgi:hypothetical protein
MEMESQGTMGFLKSKQDVIKNNSKLAAGTWPETVFTFTQTGHLN